MTQNEPGQSNINAQSAPTASDARSDAETPILVESGAMPLTGWKRIHFLFKVVEIRLRFVLVLAASLTQIRRERPKNPRGEANPKSRQAQWSVAAELERIEGKKRDNGLW